MSRFDQHIKQYYERQKLDNAKVEAILAQTGRPRRRWRYYYRTAAAAVLLVAAVGLQNHLDNTALKTRVLDEVAMNHQEQLDVEFAADHYLEMQHRLDRLDFSIVPKSSALTRNYRLVGGRYCSIQGELAAQLKVEDKISGEPADPVYRAAHRRPAGPCGIRPDARRRLHSPVAKGRALLCPGQRRVKRRPGQSCGARPAN